MILLHSRQDNDNLTFLRFISGEEVVLVHAGSLSCSEGL